jgi:hypothetical protein
MDGRLPVDGPKTGKECYVRRKNGDGKNKLAVVLTHTVFIPLKPSSALMAFSLRHFIVFNSRSVQATSSISVPFDVDGVDDDGKGRMYSTRTCSTVVLDIISHIKN